MSYCESSPCLWLFLSISSCTAGGEFNSLTPINSFFYNLLIIGGKIGVNIYILISGYFLVGKRFSFKRVFNIIITTSFYCVVIYLFNCVFTNSFDFALFIEWIFEPFIGKCLWFVPVYLFMIFFSPISNFIIKRINQKTHLLICIVTFILISVLPFILNFILGNYWNSEYLLFLFLYFVAGYIKLYGKKVKKIYIFIALLLTYAFALYQRIGLNDISNVYMTNTVTNILSAVLIFLLFKDLNFKSRSVNFVGGLTFGIYLIHEDFYVRNWLWKDVVYNATLSNSNIFPIYCIAITLVVFLTCGIIEYIRQIIFEKPFYKLVGKIRPKLTFIDKLINYFNFVYYNVILEKLNKFKLKRRLKLIFLNKFD